MENPLLLTASTAAKKLSVHRAFIYRLVDAGELECVVISAALGRTRKAIRIPSAALDRFIEKRTQRKQEATHANA